MSFLSEIIELKKARVAKARESRPIEELRTESFAARLNQKPHALRAALRNGRGVQIIAEIKRASPSRGMIRGDVHAADLARLYEVGGAAAISVLTEEDRFQGSLDDLRDVCAAVPLPVLRKDFIFDEYQLYEAAEAGADALLLIVAALDGQSLLHLRRVTEDDLKMDALVEVHTIGELERACACGAGLIGVNNRNLTTFEVSLDVSLELAQHVPKGVLSVSESGLSTAADLHRLRSLGYDAFLIGESLMRAEHPDQALRALVEGANGLGGRGKGEGVKGKG